MERAEFLAMLDGDDSYDYWLDDEEVDSPVTVMWYRQGRRPGEDPAAVTKLEWFAVEQNDWPTLDKACKQGKDVDHISRVTGYFSKTSGWNRGKQAELKDRARVKVGEHGAGDSQPGS